MYVLRLNPQVLGIGTLYCQSYYLNVACSSMRLLQCPLCREGIDGTVDMLGKKGMEQHLRERLWGIRD